jgi:hypothetical protein
MHRNRNALRQVNVVEKNTWSQKISGAIAAPENY